MRMRWLFWLAAALIVSAALVDATVSGATSSDASPTTTVYAWIGLKNSDDVGTKFEVKAEVTNGTSEGYSAPVPVPAGSSGFNNAKLVTIPVTNYSGVVNEPISVTISVRVACNSGHASGTARLWWNDGQAKSRVVDSGFGERWLTGTDKLSSSVGSGPKKTKDVFVKKTGCSPGQGDDANWQPFGTWSTRSTACTYLNTYADGAHHAFFADFGGSGFTFFAGEHVTASAGEPVYGTPAPTAITMTFDGNPVDNAGFPGTLEYTIPTDGHHTIGWFNNTIDTATDWTVTCTSP